MGNGSGPPNGGRGSNRGLLWGLIIAVVVLATGVAACSGEEAVTVPDLVGLEVADAAEALNDAGLELGNVDYELVAASSERLNTVLSQQPSPGTEVESGSRVSLVVAKGPDESAVEKGAETAPPGGSGGGSGSGTTPAPTADPKPDRNWHTLATASGTGPDAINGGFFIGSPELQLTVTVSTASGGDFRFDAMDATYDGTVVGFGTFTGTSKPTKHVREVFVAEKAPCYMRIKAPPDGEWSYTLREWRYAGYQPAPSN